MAEAEQECHLLVIKKADLEDLLDQFIDIKNQMMKIAEEKRKYHKRLINELVSKHKRSLANNHSPASILKHELEQQNWDIIKFKSLVKTQKLNLIEKKKDSET